jgi:hypothetical protein
MRRLVHPLLFLASAAGAGILASDAVVSVSADPNRVFREIHNGPWFTSEDFGANTASDRVRTMVARKGLFALKKDETIYFTSTRDDDGQALDAACDYVLAGGPLAARWWSVTVYAADDFLVANPANRYSYDMNSVSAGPDGHYAIRISPRPQDGDWLFAGQAGDGPFSLTLRIYNHEAEVHSDLTGVALPSIRKEGCG